MSPSVCPRPQYCRTRSPRSPPEVDGQPVGERERRPGQPGIDSGSLNSRGIRPYSRLPVLLAPLGDERRVVLVGDDHLGVEGAGARARAPRGSATAPGSATGLSVCSRSLASHSRGRHRRGQRLEADHEVLALDRRRRSGRPPRSARRRRRPSTSRVCCFAVEIGGRGERLGGHGGPPSTASSGDDAPMAPVAHERLGTAGAASSTHYLGTATAMAVLARGGNAFDAAVAAGFVLQVVEPHLCGPGGEVPAVFVTAADPTPRVLCGQGVVPAAATVDPAARRARAADRARHRAAGRHRARGRGTAGSPCCATTARCRWPRFSPPRWATRQAGFPLVPRIPADDRRGRRALPRALAELGRDLAARRPGTGRVPPAARCWPGPGAGCWRWRWPPAAAGSTGSTLPATPGTAASSPTRSTRSADARCATSPAATTPACSPPTTWPAGRRATRPRWSSTWARLGGGEAGGRGPRGRCWPSSCCCWATRRRYRRRDGHRRDGAPGGRGGQARLRRSGGLVRRRRSDVPLAGLLVARPTRAARRALITDAASRSCGPAPRTAGRRGCPNARPRPGGERRASRRAWSRRADRRRAGPSRRHRARRRGGRGRQHDLRDPVRRLAAVLADHPGARVLPGYPGPDVLAGARAWPRRWSPAGGRAPR